MDSSDSSDVIMSDRRLTVREIANIVGIRKFSIQRILTNELKMLQVWEVGLVSSEGQINVTPYFQSHFNFIAGNLT